MRTLLCAGTTLVGCALVFSACGSDTPAGGTPTPTPGAGQPGTAGGPNGTAGSTPVSTAGAAPGAGAGGALGTAGSPGAGGALIAGGAPATGGVPGTGGANTGGAAGASSGITVALGSTLQTMDGFGINNVFQPAFSTDYLDQLFTTRSATAPTAGIGLSIMRIGMASTGDLYNGAADVKAAAMRGVTKFVGSVWTAPANCKDNSSLTGGGHMLTTGMGANDGCYKSWANMIAAFPAKVKTAAGVDLYAMSPANEPDFASCGFDEPCNGDYDTMLYNATEAVKMVNIVGPLLHALTPPVKLMTPEASEWVHLWTNNSASGSVPSNKPSSNPLKGVGYDYGHAFFKDPTSWGLIDLIGVHQYDSQVAEPWPADVTTKKPIWQTEMSGVKWWPEQGPSTDINNAVVVAGWIHDAIVHGPASAWIWWWPKPLQTTDATNDNEGLWLKDGTKTKRLYTLGNFSNFIRPGYTRVDITGSASSDVLLSAYKGADGTVVIVAINKGAAAVTVPITISGGTAPTMLTPWLTSATADLAAQAAVPVTAGVFNAALDSKTVTTFVGK